MNPRKKEKEKDKGYIWAPYIMASDPIIIEGDFEPGKLISSRYSLTWRAARREEILKDLLDDE